MRIQEGKFAGLGTAFFSVQNIPFFPVHKNAKERKRTQKNAKNETFFYKERKERNVLLKRTDAQPCKFVN